jgi:hypothetical protein
MLTMYILMLFGGLLEVSSSYKQPYSLLHTLISVLVSQNSGMHCQHEYTAILDELQQQYMLTMYILMLFEGLLEVSSSYKQPHSLSHTLVSVLVSQQQPSISIIC